LLARVVIESAVASSFAPVNTEHRKFLILRNVKLIDVKLYTRMVRASTEVYNISQIVSTPSTVRCRCIIP